MRTLAAALMLASCGSDLPAQSFIDKLRVLAVQAEPPEVAPGTATTVRALVVEPIARAAQTIDAFWLACVPPPGTLQDVPCAVDQKEIPPQCGATAGTCIVGSGLQVSYTPSQTGQMLLTLVVADDGQAAGCLAAIQQSGMVPDHCVIAFKRLAVSEDPTNHNPGLESLQVGDFPLDGSTLTLKVTRAGGSAELDAKGNYEALSVSWFTTGGKIDGARSEFGVPGCAAASDCPMTEPSLESTTHWIAPNADQLSMQSDATRAVHFWTVVRDDRGGVSWLETTASPSPSPSPI
jgi:hypothetical protein